MNKIRISEIALEAAKKPREVLEACEALGIPAKAPGSAVTLEQAENLMEYLISGVGTVAATQKAEKESIKQKPGFVQMHDDSFLKGCYSRQNPPRWKCPECGSPLKITLEKCTLDEMTESRMARERMDVEDCRWRGIYSDFFICTNSDCEQRVIVTGYAEDYDVYADIDSARYLPSYCLPHLMFFHPPEDTPEPVKESLEESFKLFFANPKAAANQIRITLEKLLAENNLAILDKNGFVNLNRSIEKLKQAEQHKKFTEIFNCIRLIGNDGSHADGEVLREHILELYELFHIALQELYSPLRKRKEEIVAGIYRRKGIQARAEEDPPSG